MCVWGGETISRAAVSMHPNPKPSSVGKKKVRGAWRGGGGGKKKERKKKKSFCQCRRDEKRARPVDPERRMRLHPRIALQPTHGRTQDLHDSSCILTDWVADRSRHTSASGVGSARHHTHFFARANAMIFPRDVSFQEGGEKQNYKSRTFLSRAQPGIAGFTPAVGESETRKPRA